MKRAVFFVLLLVLEPYSFSQNLVINPGFETWSKITRPTGWTNAQNSLKDSVVINSGNYSCRQEGVTSSKDLGQKFSVSPGKQYRFSFFYKTVINGSGNGCRIWCEWLDNAQIPIDDPSSKTVLHSGFLKSETWQQFSAGITSPDGAENFYLLVRTLPNSITYWDDFVFEEDIISYDNEQKFSEILVYPNPAHDYLIINNLHNLQRIDIQDFTGKTVWSSGFSGEMSVTIPVSGLPEGLYIISIRTSEKVIVRKFIRKAD